MKLIGVGYEEFEKAYQEGYFRDAKAIFPNKTILQIGKNQYTCKIHRVVRINPSTGERIGLVRRLEDALRGKEWSVEIELVD